MMIGVWMRKVSDDGVYDDEDGDGEDHNVVGEDHSKENTLPHPWL